MMNKQRSDEDYSSVRVPSSYDPQKEKSDAKPAPEKEPRKDDAQEEAV